MTTWKIRHKPTGMFYQPVTRGTNLHKSGKMYHKKPALKHINHGYHAPGKGVSTYRAGEFKKFYADEWEIVAFKTVEVVESET